MARLVSAWQARRGEVWGGKVWQGSAGLGRHGAAPQGMVGHGVAGKARRGTAGHGLARRGQARQAWKQTAHDPEICFGIMNKRPPTNTAHEATLQALFPLTLSVTQEAKTMVSFTPNLINPLYRVRISGLMRLSHKEELIKFVLIILRHSLSLRYIRVYSHLSANPHSIRGIGISHV